MNNKYKFWFITGSQHLYGEETLKQVAQNSAEMVKGLNASDKLPCEIILKPTVKTSDEISQIIDDANYAPECAGIIVWMHTFSPSKMWIRGLAKLSKPYLHFHTQFNRNIPNAEIDMDFMNLNQAAHGDREHGFIAARLRMPRKIVVGYWESENVHVKIGSFMRSAVGAMVSRKLKVVRFGDNMRDVAVTEGDKVEAEIKLGWSVNTHGIGDLVKLMKNISETEIDLIVNVYKEKYIIDTDDIASVRYQAKIQAALEKFLYDGKFGAFTTNFQDLHGMLQLPGLACQELMSKGFGFGGEGDWKVSAMTHIMKAMSEGLTGGTSFMEDYTYHLEENNELALGAHMLEVCPSIASDKPAIRVYPLGIGDKEPPARLVFEAHAGNAILVSLVDMGGRMRLIVNDIKAVKPIFDMPNLPVARAMWQPMPNFEISAEAWILAGGAHHSVMSYSLNAEHMRDFAEIMGIEFVHINEKTNLNDLKRDLLLADLAWKLK